MKGLSEEERVQLAKAKAERFPSEFKPNPGYVYELPREVVINGKRCVEVDAGILPWAASMNRGK